MNVSRKDLTPEERAAWVELSEYEIDTVGRFAFGDTDTLWTALSGVDWIGDDSPALTILIVNAMTGEVVASEDPIEGLLDGICEDEKQERIERAIRALESGIARLRAAQNGPTEAP